MDIVFLDANVLFSAAYRENSRVRRLWQLTDVELITSAYAVEEARRYIVRDDHAERFERLLNSLRIVSEIPERERSSMSLPRDVKLPDGDLPILLTAIEAGASHLLTGDFRHFGQFFGREVRGVRILPPGEYLRAP